MVTRVIASWMILHIYLTWKYSRYTISAVCMTFVTLYEFWSYKN